MCQFNSNYMKVQPLGHKNIDQLTFDLRLTFTLYIPYKKVRRRSKVSSSEFYGPGS